ncbi:methylenetetrahydrofolate--tRNA-(uracil(54)-C(5))-methyltransferase (FADH(2)-oxidizing) TrmFO [Candidatus Nitronereus thalassa]|uniref:Methylenetetrahydrofolate--tRNA-(uracil-5-)-methyltransferase TrmFO n=1 Tax=Candidatus Nitronereus thalassa TaxID=3020898 RepID=A0ABU3K9Y6_9BACT|nr:methylenetetrahydrofolate--tRNA-(uracil(54)-C(5))-methyltransferase (FADH(2)-oxidizing) TrmFO [Candidatus Nitronereus thalassa]MDT7043108.1 methylenetetrahydrofolate--tRNA-(uracil(54)-C(5))-methyltransferase (FADH(2)-oxidizing) TrmFO [Candidatus Nitronereus thalassa]
MRDDVVIIGGGLAGSEAAWQAAERGAKVTLYEMRPKKETAAHKTSNLAEIVCSNSLGSADPMSAPGILKEEMRLLNSLVIRAAELARVPAGSALAVDRDIFAQEITRTLESHPNIKIIREEIQEIPRDALCIVATGPLTSENLSKALASLTSKKNLAFFDAISPIIDAESIDMDTVFQASRYDKGGADYLNCPMDEEAYTAFYDALMAAEKVEAKDFEKVPYFEGCIPIEVMAERGKQTLTFGPMKPVGLTDPRTGKRPHAVLQLRAENQHGSCYNMVGFQTKLKYPEQQRVFRMIPGLEKAEFLRLGSIHRNTFVNSPEILRNTLQVKMRGTTFLAGCIIGVEGYVESAASGGLAGINAARALADLPLITPPLGTAHGALINYITTSDAKHFQPMNTNFGLFPPLPTKVRNKEQKRRMIHQRAIDEFKAWKTQFALS